MSCFKSRSSTESILSLYPDSLGSGKKSRFSKRLAGEIALGAIALLSIGAVIALCTPQGQAWANAHIIAPLGAKQLSIGQGLLMIGLPVATLGTALAVALYARHKYKQRQERQYDLAASFTDESLLRDEERCVSGNSRRSARKTPWLSDQTKAVITLSAGALVILGLFLTYHFVQPVHHTVNTALSHKMTLGENLLVIGLPAVAGMTLLNIALLAYTNHKRKQAEQTGNFWA